MLNWAKQTLGDKPSTKDKPYPDVRASNFDGNVRKWIEKDPTTHPRPDNPPAWVKNEAIWEKAKKAVEPHWGNYSEPWAVVTHVYQQMGGS